VLIVINERYLNDFVYTNVLGGSMVKMHIVYRLLQLLPEAYSEFCLDS